MDLKNKSYRVDTRASQAFTMHCYRLGMIVERSVEALMIHSLTLDAGQLGELLEEAAKWRESGDRDD